jgi:hypothetical protein
MRSELLDLIHHDGVGRLDADFSASAFTHEEALMRRPDGYLAYESGEVVYLLPDPGRFSDARVQVAVALRNQATMAGTCPACGARGPNRAERRRAMREQRGELRTFAIVHAAECPAADENLLALISETESAA